MHTDVARVFCSRFFSFSFRFSVFPVAPTSPSPVASSAFTCPVVACRLLPASGLGEYELNPFCGLSRRRGWAIWFASVWFSYPAQIGYTHWTCNRVCVLLLDLFELSISQLCKALQSSETACLISLSHFYRVFHSLTTLGTVLSVKPQTNLSVSSFDRCNTIFWLLDRCTKGVEEGARPSSDLCLLPQWIPNRIGRAHLHWLTPHPLFSLPVVIVVVCGQNKISIQIIQQMKQENSWLIPNESLPDVSMNVIWYPVYT